MVSCTTLTAWGHSRTKPTTYAALALFLALAAGAMVWSPHSGDAEFLYLAAVVVLGRGLGLWPAVLAAAVGAAGLAAWPVAAGLALAERIVHAAIFFGLAGCCACLAATNRQMHRMLLEGQQLFDAFMRHLPCPAYIKDGAGRVIYANQACRQLWPNALGARSEDLVGEQEAGRIYEIEASVLKSGTPGRLVQVIPGQESNRWFLATRFSMAETGPAEAQLGVIGMEITEQKQVEQALLAHQARLRTLTVELQSTEQRERQRLAVALHDGVGQLLCLMKMQLDQLGPGPVCPQRMAQVSELLSEALDQTRDLTCELSPPVLEQAGLPGALKWLAERLRARHGLAVEVRADEQPEPMSNEVRGLLFQAARELLVNVIKHARARGATVELGSDGNGVWLQVSDDGKGFESGQFEAGGADGRGLGLFNIQQRIEALHGSVRVESVPGRGTQIILRVPREVDMGDADADTSAACRRS